MEVASLVLSIFAVIVSIAGIIVSYHVAKKYGDLAAVDATRRFHEEDAKRARLTALQSLVNEVERIQKVADHNRQLNKGTPIQAVTRMPVAAFETAFVSGERGLDAGNELLQAVTDYLACADSVNSLVDIYPASIAGIGTSGTDYSKHTIEKIVETSEHKLPENLERLRIYLREEIERAMG